MAIKLHTVGFGNQVDGTIEVLGGKGFHLNRMSTLGVNVPPAVIVPTTYCASVNNRVTSAMEVQVAVYDQLEEIEKMFGYMPLFSIRSGAKVSMPGMMNTILNVGLTKDTLPTWEKRIGARATWDSYRRLIQMFGDVVFNIPSSKYEEILTDARTYYKVDTDAKLPVAALIGVAGLFLEITPEFPQSFKMQLRKAIGAVFSSWNTERAIHYRNIHNISHDLGTAVIVQSMVFGNLNDKSCTGVLFTRNPSTGEDKLVGEFLVNAQGEDVVAGIRTPDTLENLSAWNAEVTAELIAVSEKLELASKDMQDIEFTVQDGKLYILQTRNAKRTAVAAVKIATDLVVQNIISKEDAFKRVSYEQYLMSQNPVIDPMFVTAPHGTGIPASSGFAVGVAAFSAEKAIELAKTAPVVLLAKETTPDDIAGMNAAVGILTQTGGSSSHAAVVARGMDKVCVVGCLDLNPKILNSDGTVKFWELNGQLIEEGVTSLTIEGTTGKIWVNTVVDVVGAQNNPSVALFNEWVTEVHPFMEKVTSGTKGYLQTHELDSNIPKFKEIVSNFEGIVVLNTGKSALEDYDNILFELVMPFDEMAVKKAKVAALAELKTSKVVHIDLDGLELTSPIKAKLTANGFKLIPTISSLEGVVMCNGLVKLSGDFILSNAAKRVIEMKKMCGEHLQHLVFIDDYTTSEIPQGATVVSSKESVLKFLMK